MYCNTNSNKFTFSYAFLCNFNHIFCLGYFSESMISLLLIFLSSNYFKEIYLFIRTKDKSTTTAFTRQGPRRRGGHGFWDEAIQSQITKFPDSGVLKHQRKIVWKDFQPCQLFWRCLEYIYSFHQRPNRSWLCNIQGKMSQYHKSQAFSLSI